MFTRTLLAAFLLCSFAQASFAETIYVDASAPSAPPGDGSSWKNAFNDLQNALAIAQAGDEIRIAQGTYKPAPPNGSREATFNLVDGVIIQGGYAGLQAPPDVDPDALDWVQFQSILSGDLNGDDQPPPQPPGLPVFDNYVENVYHVISAHNVGSTTIVRGVTITGGNANSWEGSTGYNGIDNARGAAILCSQNASPVFEHCTLIANTANFAAAVYTNAATLTLKSCSIRQNKSVYYSNVFALGYVVAEACTFTDNRVNESASAMGALAGGTLRGCEFARNFSTEGAAVHGWGLAVIDCTFIENVGSHMSAGALSASNSVVLNSRFLGNIAGCGGGNLGGGAIYSGSNVLIANCQFSGNKGPGGAVQLGYYNGGNHAIVNSTFVGNESYCLATGAIHSMGGLVVDNCILWDNVAALADGVNAQLSVVPSVTTISNSCIQYYSGASGGGEGNHGNDPRFVNAAGPDGVYGTQDDDLRLRTNSPCIDGGNNAALPPDEFDLDEDGDTSEPIPFDLDWLPRTVNKVVDLGAFEFQGAPCRADINGDSAVTVDDLLAVLFAWGSCPMGQPEGCDSDLNLDGQVDTDDLLELLQGWGACP